MKWVYLRVLSFQLWLLVSIFLTYSVGGAIGARTTEIQGHRQLASALSCPVGFKNGTDGNVKIALDAIKASSVPHVLYSPDKCGQMCIYRTHGNPYSHVILRGGKVPNYHKDDINDTCENQKKPSSSKEL